MSIFPYVYYMIKDFGVAKHESEISVYAGMVTSAFAFAEFSSGVAWGRLSDKIGRKPILLTGLAGTAISMLIFGFAPNLPVALLARALGGLLNGYAPRSLTWRTELADGRFLRNVGVLQTTVAEMVTVKEHQRKLTDHSGHCGARAFALTGRSPCVYNHARCVVSRVSVRKQLSLVSPF